MSTCESCKRQMNDDWVFCRYCGTEVIQSFDLNELLSLDLYKSSDLLTPSGGKVDGFCAVLVNLTNHQQLENRHLKLSENQVALTRVLGYTWTESPQRPQTGSLSELNNVDQLAILNTRSQILELVIENLVSGDPIPTVVECAVEIKITTFESMVDSLEVEDQVFTLADVGNSLLPEMDSTASKFLHEVVFSDQSHSNLAVELSGLLWETITPILEVQGITVCGGLSVNIYQVVWSEDTDESVRDLISSTESEPTRSLSKAPHLPASSMLALTEETSLSLPSRRRAAILNNVRLTVLSKRYSSADGREAFSELLNSLDPDQLISLEHRDATFHSFSDFSQDPKKSNTLLIKRLALEIEHEIECTLLIREYGLSDERLVLEYQKARTKFQSVWEIERNRVSIEFDHRQDRLESGYTNLAESPPTPHIDLSTVVERGLDWYARYKEIKREDQSAQATSAITLQHQEAMFALEREAASVEIRLRQDEADHRRRLEEIEALSQVGIETLIAISGPEQGNLLLQLSKTRALQGFTPEKILALQGIHSPLITDAVREVSTALAINGQGSGLLDMAGGSNPRIDNPGPREVAELANTISESLETVKNHRLISGVHPSSRGAAAALSESGLSEHETMTILFSDIKGSTEITDRLGDIAAQELFKEHNNIVRDQVSEFHGHEIKSMGDGFMLAFPSALNGILCAIQIQKMLLDHNNSGQQEPIMVRIGLHAGEVIRENEDYFGRNVILASRISSQAKENQILVSSILKEMTASFNQLEFDSPMSIALKGLPGDTIVYPVTW